MTFSQGITHEYVFVAELLPGVKAGPFPRLGRNTRFPETPRLHPRPQKPARADAGRCSGMAAWGSETMIAETQKAPEGAYCAPALRRSIFRLQTKDGWIISALTLKSSLRFLPCPAVKAHDSIRADQSQNASKVDRKSPGNADPCAPAPWRSSDCAAADTEKGRFGVWGVTEYLNPAKVGTWRSPCHGGKGVSYE